MAKPSSNAPPVARLLRPMQEFIHQSTSGGIVLIAAIVVALMLANSPAASAYSAVLHTEFGITLGAFSITHDLHHWINDGLMAIFFFLVGLEIKREVLVGELADRRAALLPIGAALGGALVPAALYWLIAGRGATLDGWAIPMATDIAIALGVLALVGRRAPPALTIFLTAVAIADDLLAIIIIAVFYTGSVSWLALGIAAALLAVLALLNWLGVRAISMYALVGLAVWLAFEQSGIHATIAGVLVAWTIPARVQINPQRFSSGVRSLLEAVETPAPTGSRMLTDETQQSALRAIEDYCEQVQAPLQKVEHKLHPWVAFGILPLFALANAGIPLELSNLESGSAPAMLGIGAGLVAGKPLGFMGAAWLLVRSGLATLPAGVRWRHVLGSGMLAGIGFTMALFIAALSFGEGPLLAAAKLSIVAASLLAGVLGYALLRTAPANPAPAN